MHEKGQELDVVVFFSNMILKRIFFLMKIDAKSIVRSANRELSMS